ncbi:LysR family transcriptional regulator [Magnetospirillum sp. ME-1]|uniref:transcriptional regulator GcvA n=1 Tax=Magnetospirillum sp. ME-1 TaxID=1639348 RepID=UPI000A17DA99|nr:transcriptional regulator GcvA [Magnetospirillum sp. ME-1]ARJ68054.1 LysR family transcriptional regulator [Magnetospirillum sp. ME-1]
MAYRLPPLNSLRLFEAAGRHLSFKLAAEELNLTPSAVSHGIASLEDWLGVQLFARGHRSLALTSAGRAYLPRIRDVLQQLAGATESVPGRKPTGRLSVSVAPSFGLRWLIPGLPRFHERHPDIEVSLDTARRQVEFPRDGIDVAIRMGQGGWQDLYSLCLTMEDLVPVCAPGMAARIRTPDDLRGETLLQVSSISEDWAAWAGLAGVEGLDLERGLKLDTLHMAWEAASQGVGIALGRLPLAAPDLDSGRLVPVLGPPRRCRTGYWLVAGRDSLARPEVVAFRNWLREELAAHVISR